MYIMRKRISDNKLRVRTDSDYVIELLVESGKAKLEKTTRIGTTFVIEDDVKNIPDKLSEFIDYLKNI